MVVGEFTVETELAVIGAGPGGYAAACRARSLGLETTLIDSRPPGGTWLYDGCLPSKRLARLARLIHLAADAADLGITFGTPEIDLARLQSQLRSEIDEASSAMRQQLDRLGVTYVEGRARFDDNRQLSIEDAPQMPRVRFRRAIIACGVTHARPPGLPDDPRIVDAGAMLYASEVPRSMLVIGGSTMALEIATIFAAFGSEVHLATIAPCLLPGIDEELAAVVRPRLAKRLASLTADTEVRVELGDGGGRLIAHVGGGQPLEVEKVVYATGRTPALDELGLSRTQVTLDDLGFVLVDDTMRTNDPRVFAVGDVTGEPMLAVRAAHQGRIAAEAVAGWGTTFDTRTVPLVVYTDPPLAWCGATEHALRANGEDYAVARAGVGDRSGCLTDEDATKILYDPATQLILGVGVVGPDAGAVIAEAALAIEMGAVLTDLAATLHPRPGAAGRLEEAARLAIDQTTDVP